MSFAGRVVSSNGCVTKPKARETGLHGWFVQIRSSSLTGSYVMEMAEQREPYESRGSRTVVCPVKASVFARHEQGFRKDRTLDWTGDRTWQGAAETDGG